MVMQLSESYLQNLIGLQTQLYAYILTLLADATAADDVLQETNLVLCRKADEFDETTSYPAWAFRIRYQCFAYWKVRSRDRLIFNEEALDAIATRVEQRLGIPDDRTRALRQCLGLLPTHQRELLEGRYSVGGSVRKLAEKLGRRRPRSRSRSTASAMRWSIVSGCVWGQGEPNRHDRPSTARRRPAGVARPAGDRIGIVRTRSLGADRTGGRFVRRTICIAITW